MTITGHKDRQISAQHGDPGSFHHQASHKSRRSKFNETIQFPQRSDQQAGRHQGLAIGSEQGRKELGLVNQLKQVRGSLLQGIIPMHHLPHAKSFTHRVQNRFLEFQQRKWPWLNILSCHRWIKGELGQYPVQAVHESRGRFLAESVHIGLAAAPKNLLYPGRTFGIFHQNPGAFFIQN